VIAETSGIENVKPNLPTTVTVEAAFIADHGLPRAWPHPPTGAAACR